MACSCETCSSGPWTVRSRSLYPVFIALTLYAVQLGQQLYQQQQQQLQHHKQQAKIISTLAAQRAQADLQQIKQVQERKKIHAAELRAQIGKQRMDTK